MAKNNKSKKKPRKPLPLVVIHREPALITR